MNLRFRLTAEHLELNPRLGEAGYVEGDIFETDIRNIPEAEGKVGPRPGDKNKNAEEDDEPTKKKK